jgi:hypothetical protein
MELITNVLINTQLSIQYFYLPYEINIVLCTKCYVKPFEPPMTKTLDSAPTARDDYNKEMKFP